MCRLAFKFSILGRRPNLPALHREIFLRDSKKLSVSESI